MRTKHLLISIVLGLIIGASAFSLFLNGNNEGLYTPRSKSGINPNGISGAQEWRQMMLVNPETGNVDPADLIAVEQQIKENRKNKGLNALELDWTEMGPNNVGGRTRAILIDKDDHNLMYAGGVGGGLWKSTTGGSSWTLLTVDDFPNLAVSCITQASNGDIYFGTGEGFANSGGTPYNSGARGQGIFKSTDGENFTQLSSTWDPTGAGSQNNVFYYVNEIACDPSNSSRIYAATANGLRISDDGGSSWTNGIAVGFAGDVAVASDGTVLASVNNKLYLSASGDASSFEMISTSTDDDAGGNADKLVSHNGVGRFEIAFSPEDPNYIYVSSANTSSTLKHIYKSTDKGDTWEVIGSKSSLFSPFSNSMGGQGRYDNIIKVFPNDKDKAILGGVYSLWIYANETWTPISQWYLPETSSAYVHADHHAIVFHPDYKSDDNPDGNEIFYVGSDGGISKYSGSIGFQVLNKNYNVTQFYSVSCSPTDDVLGGTQDNGTKYINQEGNTVQTAYEFSGGDGGYCAISTLNPDVAYSTYVQGRTLYRTDKGIEDGAMETFVLTYDADASFVTPIRLWESFNDTKSTDSITYIHDTLYDLSGGDIDTIVQIFHQGETIFIPSAINERPIPYYVTQDSIVPGDTIKVQDIYQAALAFGDNDDIKVARNALNFAEDPKFYSIVHDIDPGVVKTLEWSMDGDHIYFTNSYGELYRCDGILDARKYSYESTDTTTTMSIEDDLTDIISIDSTATDSTINNVVLDTVGYTTDTTFTVDSIVFTDSITITDSIVLVDTTIYYDSIVVFDTIVYDTNWSYTTTPNIEYIYLYDYNYDIDTVFGKDTTYNVTITPATVNVNTFDSVKTYQIHNFSSIISGIAVDPNNADNVVITLGGYGSGNHVYYSTNATSTNPTFNLKEGNLPDMPVYCALIDKNDANLVIIGTEYGVYLTENITASSPTWVEQNSGTLGNVPIYQITQQKFDNGFYGSVDSGVRNGGYIYIASHGRGIFKTESLKDPTFIPEIKPENADNTFVKPVHIYPNPVVDNANVAVNLNERTDVNIKVYNLFGKLILEDNYANQTAGEHIYRFSSETLANGTYLVSVKAGNEVSSSKFVVY